MRILGTTETVHFDNIDDARALIRELEKTITYELAEKNMMQTGEVIDCPILPSSYTNAPIATISGGKKQGINFLRLDGGKSFTIKRDLDSQMEEAMRETRLVLGSVNASGTFEPQPLALNALPSLISQAIGGKSSVLCQTEDKAASKQMRTEVKAAVINEFLSLRKDRCKLYLCDGMVRYVASDSYVYLPISELLDTLEKEIGDLYPDASFESANISHQYCEFVVMLNDAKLKQDISDILQQVGKYDDYEPAVIFATSNTGDCGANLYPVLMGTGKEMMIIEEPSTMEHIGTASVEKFAEHVRGLMALFQATPERLEKLGEIGLKHPANAYKNVAYKSNLPVASYAEKAEVFETCYCGMATAIDLYFELSNQLYAYAEQTNMGIIRRTKLLNSLSQKFLSPERLKDCDVDIVFSTQH